MDNESPFVGKVDEEARLVRLSTVESPGLRPSSAAENSSLPNDPAGDDDLFDEDTPLLSRFQTYPQRESTSTEVGHEEAIHQPWMGAKELEGQPWWKKPSIFWLLPAFFPFALAFGGVIVPKLNLILNLLCRDYFSDRATQDPSFQFMPVIFGADNPQCQIPEVQAMVSRFMLYGNLLAGGLSAIITPKLGAMSDRYGRKKAIAYASLGTFLAEIVTIVVANYPDTFSVYWILLGFFFDGLCGSFTASMALTYSYAADCTPPARRNVSFGYFHGVLFTGIALGPFFAGYLIKWTGEILIVFYIALGCHLFFLLFLLFVIPESLSQERQQHAREKHKVKVQEHVNTSWLGPSQITNFLEPLKILWPTGEGSSPGLRRNLVLLAGIDTIMFGVAMGTMSIVIYYAEFMFNWGNFESSMFQSVVNLSRVFALFAILPSLTRFARGPISAQAQRHEGSDKLDINVIRMALVFDLCGYIGYATAQNGGWMMLAGAVAAFGGAGSPTLQSSLTKHVPPVRTGQVLGATGLLHALARVIAPTVFNLIYSVTVGRFTQAVFVCLASLFVLALIMSLFLKPKVYLDDPNASRPRTRAAGDNEAMDASRS